MAQQQVVRSRVNQPERLLIRSDDDITNANQSGFSQFQVNLQTPVLDPKRAQIIRTTIPNIQLQIPDYQLVFWYHALATATTAPSAATLRAVRLFPSYYQAPAGLTFTPTKNRYITDPNDFVTLLNVAAGAGGDSVTFNPYWVSGQVTFAYNATTKQITMTGNTAATFFTPAGYADPFVLAAIAGGTIVCPQYNNAAITFAQPLLAQYTLNLRTGYALSGNTPGRQSFANGNRLYANIVNVAFANAVAVPADSFPDLVYSNSVSLYASFITGSSLTSNNRHNLLAVCPIQTVSLGVNSYVAATSNLLTKLSQTINNIIIEMRDSADQPYILPDSCQVDLEISFSYQDKAF
jgi:hypothetical protein